MGATGKRRGILSGVVFVIAAAVVSTAQQPTFRTVDNPYQQDFPYAIGADLSLNVEIQGLRWTLMKIAPREGREIEADKENQVDVTLEFENRGTDSAKVQVVLLLEDDNGSPLSA